jgi:hypothetical protein
MTDQLPQASTGSGLRIEVEPALRDELAVMAAGRTLVIDYFASKRCGVVSGDLTVAFQDEARDEPLAEAAPSAGVRIAVDARLRDVLAASGPTLRLSGPRFRRRLAIELERPELWLDFLNRPGVLRGRLWG